MKKRTINRTQQLEEMICTYKKKQSAIKNRLQEFSHISPSEYFYEILYCLLTPQSSAIHAEKAVASLRTAEFDTRAINPEPFLRQKENYIRFHKTKARYLIQLKKQFPYVAAKLMEQLPSPDLREWLVTNVKGMGYKEATHFLRNIGRNDYLAILDRHILRTLRRLGVIRTIPNYLSRKRYLSIESRFAKFAGIVGIPLDELDLLFWSLETGEIRK